MSFMRILFKAITQHYQNCISFSTVCLFGKQCGPRSDCSYKSGTFWVHAFASILNSSVMLGNYLQQTTTTDDMFICIFLGALRVKLYLSLLNNTMSHPDFIVKVN